MRTDANNLLRKLGRQEFQYQEFADHLGDMELWPLFEALLQDERLFGRPVSRIDAKRVSKERVILDNVHPLPTKPEVNRVEDRVPSPSNSTADGARPIVDEELDAFLGRLNAWR